MHSHETKCMSITQAGQMRGNKRFLSGKQIQQFATVLDTCIVLSIFFSQLYVNKTKQQAVPIQALSFFTCTRHISISICVYTKLYQWCKIIMLIQNL
jgi:cadmium resistance protein CadD (predicted permease)